MLKTIRYLYLLAVAVALSPLAAQAVEPGLPLALISPEQAVGIGLGRAVQALPATDERSKAIRDGLARFYGERNNEPLWLAGNQLGYRVNALMEEFGRAADWGLDPAAYALPAVAPGGGAGARVEAELAVTLTAVRYATHAHSGRIDPQTISRIIDRGSTPPDAYELLRALAATDTPAKVLLAYQPKHEQFLRLKKKLAELRGSAAAEGAKPPAEEAIQIPAGPLLKPGLKHEQVALLRQRLKVAPAAGANPVDVNFYDAGLEAAVRAFQQEKGLQVDGLVGRGMRAALNGVVVVRDRPELQIQRILVGMERWRWMMEDMGEFYVLNNVPEFMQYVVNAGKVVRSERIIVGKGSTPTPTFSKRLEFIEFMPFWNVPNSIKVEEIRPGLINGTNIMEVQGLSVDFNGRRIDPYSVDWESVDVRRFRFYQTPGGKNVLGVVKFMFPNRHDVYMHDTPSKSLFNDGVRTISHGCMRVRNPLDLAEKILGYDQGWTLAAVHNAVARGNTRVDLKKPVQVHVTYFTSWVGDDGKISTFGDIYGHDRRVAMALNGAANVIADEDRGIGSSARAASDPGPSLWDTFNTKKKPYYSDVSARR